MLNQGCNDHCSNHKKHSDAYSLEDVNTSLVAGGSSEHGHQQLIINGEGHDHSYGSQAEDGGRREDQAVAHLPVQVGGLFYEERRGLSYSHSERQSRQPNGYHVQY